MSCGTSVEGGQSRCLECGAPQRRFRLVGGRLPAGPLVAVMVILTLLISAVVIMMVGDRKAGPSRAYEKLREAVESRDCELVWELMSRDGQALYRDKAESCAIATDFAWDAASILNVQVDAGDKAVLCVNEPPGYGMSFEKLDDEWLADSSTPVRRSECIQEPVEEIR